MKKMLCSLLLAVLLFASPVGAVSAAADYSEGYFNYTVSNEVVMITGYFGSESSVTVPNRLAGYPVYGIAAGAFSGNDSVSSVILPSDTMKIEAGAFSPSQTVIYAVSDPKNEPSVPPVQENISAEAPQIISSVSGVEVAVEVNGDEEFSSESVDVELKDTVPENEVTFVESSPAEHEIAAAAETTVHSPLPYIAGAAVLIVASAAVIIIKLKKR